MVSAAIAFAGALLVAILLTPIVRRFAIDIGAVDRPGERRVHARAIPRLGGIAIAAAFFVPLLCLFAIETQVAQVFFAVPMRMVGLAIGGLMVCGLGVLDDVRGVRAWHKLWVQVAAACVAYLCGYRIDAIALPFIGHLDMGIFGVVVTAFWVVAIVNAVNLIDGLDGLAGGVAFFACVTNFVVGHVNGDPVVTLLSASLGGALLGFLLYNFNPASIFMGDSGSMFLGYVLATTSILGNSVKSSTTVAILVPLVALGLPIMDTLFAMVRRFLERRPIFAADRGHIHHRLLAMGLTHRRAVIILYGLSIVFTFGAIMLSIGRNWQVGAALVVLSVAVIGVMRAMGNFQAARRGWMRRERMRPPSVERLRVAVPAVLQRISGARDIKDLQAIVCEFAERAGISEVEMTARQEAAPETFSWRGKPIDEREPVETVTVSYALDALGAETKVHFTWGNDQSEVAPEAEILLQLVVDAWSTRLSRGSEARRAVTTGHLRPVS